MADVRVVRMLSPYRSRSEEHTSELQSLTNLVCHLLLEKKKGGSDQAVLESICGSQDCPLHLDPRSVYGRASRPVYMDKYFFFKIFAGPRTQLLSPSPRSSV